MDHWCFEYYPRPKIKINLKRKSYILDKQRLAPYYSSSSKEGLFCSLNGVVGLCIKKFDERKWDFPYWKCTN